MRNSEAALRPLQPPADCRRFRSPRRGPGGSNHDVASPRSRLGSSPQRFLLWQPLPAFFALLPFCPLREAACRASSRTMRRPASACQTRRARLFFRLHPPLRAVRPASKRPTSSLSPLYGLAPCSSRPPRSLIRVPFATRGRAPRAARRAGHTQGVRPRPHTGRGPGQRTRALLLYAHDR